MRALFILNNFIFDVLQTRNSCERTWESEMFRTYFTSSIWSMREGGEQNTEIYNIRQDELSDLVRT